MKIYIDYQPFGASTCFIIKEDSNQIIKMDSNLQTIGDKLVNLAYQNDIYEIHVKSPEIIVNEITRQIVDTEVTKYSFNKIRVIGV